MTEKKDRIGYQTDNALISVPSAWNPDLPTLEALVKVSQLVIERLQLNIGMANIEFIEDATVIIDKTIIRSVDNPRQGKSVILIHPKQTFRASGWATSPEVFGTAAAAVAVTNYRYIHPSASERDQLAVILRAQRITRDYLKPIINTSP